MFNIVQTNNTTYGEIDQRNPLRWRIMYKSKDTLTDQSGLIKCKDFFNDVVAYKQAKRPFSVYGFSNKVKFNRNGLYLWLTFIANTDKFIKNLEPLNKRLDDDLGVQLQITKQDDGSVVLLIPTVLWRSTWYISLVTMLIRCCNYDYEYNTWDDFFADTAPLCTSERAFTPQAKTNAKSIGFNLPIHLRKYWFWGGDKCNSEVDPNAYANTIHNNGVSSWSNFLKA